MRARRTVAFSTLGCKLNQFESDSLATRFEQAGYRCVAFDGPADIYIINSCTVTNRADRKSRNLLYRAERRQGALSDVPLIVLTGCFVDSHRDEIESDPHTFVVPNENKHMIFELVDAHFNGEVIAPSGSVFDFPNPNRSAHTRTTLKIQDGCDNFCTFCIIPFVRGRATSRPHREILASAQQAINTGSRELVLTGVNLSRFRDDGKDFGALVQDLLELTGDYRLRISSLEPDGLTQEFIELFRHPRMVPHLHLCLQSASERILLAMRRQYTYDAYREIVESLRRIDTKFNITTDLIVGFPGETYAEHQQNLAAIRENHFGHVHTFSYSVRSGTRAERMPGHVSTSVKKQRNREVRELAEQQTRLYRESLTGTYQTVLVEQVDHTPSGWEASGYSEYYVPVSFPVSDSCDEAVNTVQTVLIQSISSSTELNAIGRVAAREPS